MLYICFICFVWTNLSFGQNDEVLADNYFKKGEFQKALIIYKNIYKEKPFNFNYLYKIINTHQQLEQFNEAENEIMTWLNKVRTPMVVVELGYNYQLKDSLELAKKYYNEAISYVDEKPNYIYSIAKKFEDHSLLEEAIEIYKKGNYFSARSKF